MQYIIIHYTSYTGFLSCYHDSANDQKSAELW